MRHVESDPNCAPVQGWRKVLPSLCITVFLCATDAARAAEPAPLAERAQAWLERAKVTAPPADLRLNPFYKKYVDVLGLPVVASEHAHDEALLEMGYLTHMMLGNRPDVVNAMRRNGTRLAIIAANEYTTDLPEFADMEPKNYWDRRSRGMGAIPERPVMTSGEENLLGLEGDPYRAEGIFVHEFAHAIHDVGLAYVEPQFNDRLTDAFEKAKAKGLWKGKYAMMNTHEYWAEGVQSYFGTNRENDHDHNHVNTRAELKEYDPLLFAMIDQALGPNDWQYTAATERGDQLHLAKLDRSQLPKFTWPQHLQEESEKLEAVKRQRLIEAGEAPRPETASPAAQE